MSYEDEETYENNVYLVTVPMVTQVTMLVSGHPNADTDELALEAIQQWKRGGDAYYTGAIYPNYDDVEVQLHQDNNPEPEVNEDPPEDWEREPEVAS